MTEEQPTGFLLIDKPEDWTSFDVVAKLRRITGIRKIGHAGTLDPEGEIKVVDDGGKYDAWPNMERIKKAIADDFLGAIKQVPPMHSAIKIGGKRLYKLAREGKEIERPPREVVIHRFDALAYEDTELKAVIEVGSGTYIRAIARDLGEYFGLGAYCKQLRRTKIDRFDVADAYTIDQVTPENWQSLLIHPTTAE